MHVCVLLGFGADADAKVQTTRIASNSFEEYLSLEDTATLGPQLIILRQGLCTLGSLPYRSHLSLTRALLLLRACMFKQVRT